MKTLRACALSSHLEVLDSDLGLTVNKKLGPEMLSNRQGGGGSVLNCAALL